MELRSWYICRDATAQPPFTSPTTADAGNRTSSKNSSQNSRVPSTMRTRFSVTPAARVGTRNIVRPRCLGTVQSVRARHSA